MDSLGRLSLSVVVLLSWHPLSVRAQVPASPVASPDTAGVRRAEIRYPDLDVRREIALLGFGAAFTGAGGLVQEHHYFVPPSGFDPHGIPWALDRHAVGNYSPAAGTASDRTLDASLLFPVVLGLVTAPPGEGWRQFGSRSLVYGETFLLSEGLTYLGKTAFGRPRPYAYRPEGERPGRPTEATGAVTFQSMPSGHSSAAWTAVALGLTEHLLLRPHASWLERAGVGVLGGTLAGATSALRVAAGQHFPSDVIAGAGIGIASGVAVPLAHRGELTMPPLSSWLEVTGGVAAGAMLGIVAARGY